MRIKRMLLLTMLVTFWLFLPLTLAYFDHLSPGSSDEVAVGGWGYRYDNVPVTGSDVRKLIDSSYSDPTINQFLKDSFFHEVSGAQIIDTPFCNYLMKDMRNMVTLTDQFRSDFLASSGGTFLLTTTEKQVTLDPAQTGSFLPGDCRQIVGLIHTADLTSAQSFEIIISMEAGNQNFYDFALEIFFDANVFSPSDLFTYSYTITDLYITNTYVQSSIVPVTAGTFRTRYQNSKTNYYYDYQLQVPGFPGMWSRFSTGPRYFPQSLNGKFKNYQPESNPSEQNGLMLIGKGKGGLAQLRIRISSRMLHFPSEASPIIPIIFNITRGMPSSGSPSTVPITPVISFGVKRV